MVAAVAQPKDRWVQVEQELLAAKQALSAGDGQAAVAALNRLLAARPDHAEALYLMALCANAAGRTDVAIDCLRRAGKAAPDDADIAFSLGSLLSAAAPDEALHNLREAVRLRPGFAAAWTNLGNLLAGMGLLEQAGDAYEQALAASPDLVEVETNLGVIRQSQGLHDEALSHHETAIRHRPGFRTGHHNRLMSMHYNARLNPDEIVAAHRSWGRSMTDALAGRKRKAVDFTNSREKTRILRIGYVSPDFRRHPVASFFLPLLEAHDRSQVDIWCYSDVARPDPMTEAVREHADHWVDVSGLDDAALTARILSDRIDILVDLAGHTSRNRLFVFAGRAAPLQMTWLGYPGITGLPAMDCRLTDAVADPPDEGDRWEPNSEGEELVCLPDGFLCYRPPVDVAPSKPAPGTRSVVFGSFNNFAKVNERLLDCWADILKLCPDSQLLLKARSLNDPGTAARCSKAFAARGVDPARIQLRGTVPGLAEHFTAYDDMDVALDTFPYNGTTTTFDALYMGTPVITLRGDRHAARVGASILTHLGLKELIAETSDDYVQKARLLAGDLPRRSSYVAGLRRKLATSPLLDAPRFARTIEKTYRGKWNKWVETAGLL